LSNKYICIHGHFYQPPRENPWLDEVESQDSAHPYHDWNQRITAECYARNAASRILDANKRIINIVNNYSRISFNFGPTLLSWLEKKEPETYQAILEADRISQKNFSGHGSALAQVYSHVIMPLANSRDKRTQVVWGIKDFEHRFKRRPEGMWLAETAVDSETLEIMAEQGIKFTILAPHQAKRVKKMGDHSRWRNLTEHKIDPKMPYVCRLPSGREMVIFFYDGPAAQAVAFEGLLSSGESFARRLIGIFDQHSPENQLAHIATDGETYGHHHKFGDMALAYCLNHIETFRLATITIYGEYLEKNPASYEVEIIESSSWSCAHGVERWRSNCGCHVGHPGWNQEWRAPLREALDWLRDQMSIVYEREMRKFCERPWEIREAYIAVILNRHPDQVKEFLQKNIPRDLSEEEKIKVLRLLEMQHNALLMYTSCGWFFDEISGIEATQILKYAARALQLTQEVSGEDLEYGFIKILEKAKSNVSELQHGATIYKMFVKPSVVDLPRVGAHYALTSLFEEYSQEIKLYCYTIQIEKYERKEAGRNKLAVGKGWVRSDITWERMPMGFAVLHLGDHNLIGGVEYLASEEKFFHMYEKILNAFLGNNIPEAINLINTYFGSHHYSLWHLFRHEQQRILNQVLKSATQEIESSFRQIYEHNYSLMQIQDDIQLQLPKTLATVVEYIFNRDLCEALESEHINIERLQKLVAEMKRWAFERDRVNLGYITSSRINELMMRFLSHPDDHSIMEMIIVILRNLSTLSLNLDLWRAQNIYFSIGRQSYAQKQEQAASDKQAQRWVSLFEDLGQILQVKIN